MRNLSSSSTRLAFEILRIALALQALVDVDVLLERERGIQHRFDALQPELFDGLADLARMVGRVLDDIFADLFLAAPEQHVVAREVGVTEHMRGHQHVLGNAVARREIRVPGIAGEHHLEQARVPHAVLDQLVDVAHAERPVRHAHRQAVDRDLHHEAVGHGLEVDGIEGEAGIERELLDARHELAPFRRS